MRMVYPPELKTGLKAFGLNEKESLIYLAGLEFGEATVLELARRTKISRTTLYPILEDMRARGIFRYGKSKRRVVYTAEAPAILAKEFTTREKDFMEVVGKLEALHGVINQRAGVTLYEGGEGFRQLWQKIFRSNVKEYRIITTGAGMLEFVHEPYLVDHIIQERMKRGIKSLQLIPDSSTARKIIAKDEREFRESRLLPAGTSVPATIIIFGNEVAFITTRKENTMILVASGEAAATHKTLFDLLWAQASAR